MDLNLDRILTIVGTVISIVCLALTVRDRNRVEIRYQFFHDILIGEKAKPLPDEVTVHYRGRTLVNLKKSNLVLWNRGTQSIESDRLSRPFTIVFPEDTKILYVDIIKHSADENEVRAIHAEGTSVELGFAYLGVGQGVNVEILYSCDEGFPGLSATLIENADGLVDNRNTRPKTFLGRVFTIPNVVCVLLGMVAPLIWHLTPDDRSPQVLLAIAGLPAIITLLFAI